MTSLWLALKRTWYAPQMLEELQGLYCVAFHVMEAIDIRDDDSRWAKWQLAERLRRVRDLIIDAGGKP